MSTYLRSFRDYLRAHKRFISIFIPIFLGVLFMALCIVQLQRTIWFDESYSAYLTRFDFGKVWELTSADVHPPLYYFVLKTWAHFFGHTEVAMRMLSVIFGAIAILFIYRWLKYKYGLTAATLATFFLAISPFFIRYGQEMRMYTMVVAIVAAATYVLQLAIDNGKKRWWIIYSILVALGMWTHYFCAFAWLAHVVYLAIIYGKKIFQKRIVLTYLSSVAMFLPWVPSLISQTASVQASFWVGDLSIKTIADYITELFVYRLSDDVKSWLVVLVLACLVVLITLAIKYRSKLKFLLAMALVPVALLIITSMPPLEPLFVSRYILYAVAATAVIPGVALVFYLRDHKKRDTKKARNHRVIFAIASFAIIVTTSIAGIASVYSTGNFNFNTNIMPSAKDLYETIGVLDGGNHYPVISASEWLYYDLAFYTSTNNPVYFIDEMIDYKYGSLYPLRDAARGNIRDLDKFLSDRDTVWFVVPLNDDGSFSSQFPRQSWQIAEYTNYKASEHAEPYAIVKMVKE
jgi:4-amino-4-deoxy-L-arabinose transferase-like glycosyltransferase